MSLRRLTRPVAATVLCAALLALPDAAPSPVSVDLVGVQGATAVDFENEAVWILALGSDARPSEDVVAARTDAIELIGLRFDTGAAVALGIPRDSWIDIDEHGFSRINEALALGGTRLVATEVQQLTGILPHYVVVTGFEGFASMVDAVGGVVLRSDRAFTDEERGISLVEGDNELDGDRAVRLARARKGLLRGDFDRAANHQSLLRSILAKLRAREDEEGFIETATTVSLDGLRTDLSPTELYRLAQAITRIDPSSVSTCVLDAVDRQVGAASVLTVDEVQARRLAEDARDDATLERGCRG